MAPLRIVQVLSIRGSIRTPSEVQRPTAGPVDCVLEVLQLVLVRIIVIVTLTL